jgi:release factor glutamine methyltransferase
MLARETNFNPDLRAQDGPASRAARERFSSLIAAHSGLHRAARLIQRASFRLFKRHRHRRLALERIDGLPFVVFPDVFNPRLFRTGEMLARHLAGLSLPANTRILDLGCGSGVAAILAARQGIHPVAVDINPEAVRCTRLNVLLNGVEDRVDIREGDLFAPVRGERFDLVLFNPPFFAGRAREPWEHAWWSEDVLDHFIAGLPGALAPNGRAIVVLSTVAKGALARLQASRLHVRILAERQLLMERLSIVEVAP